MHPHATRSLIAAGLLLAAPLPTSVLAAGESGDVLYSNYCQSCHGAARSSRNWSASLIRNAITRNRGGMGSLSFLTDTQLSGISAYLANPNGTVADAPTAAPTNEADRVFDWAEATYPFMFLDSTGSQQFAGYHFRHYPSHNLYLATVDGRLYFYDGDRPEDGLLDMGPLSEWSARADAAAASVSTNGGYGDDRQGYEVEHDEYDDDDRYEYDHGDDRHEYEDDDRYEHDDD